MILIELNSMHAYWYSSITILKYRYKWANKLTVLNRASYLTYNQKMLFQYYTIDTFLFDQFQPFDVFCLSSTELLAKQKFITNLSCVKLHACKIFYSLKQAISIKHVQ